MPELPEVESVKRSLAKRLPKGVRWTEVTLNRKDLRVPFPKNLKKELLNTELIGLDRRAKFLIFKRKGKDLISHLGMSGTWRVLKENEPPRVHDHLIFGFDNGLKLAYNDPRRFGLVDWGGEDSPWLKKLGPEPLSQSFNEKDFYQAIHRRSAAIKVLLMNPQIVVGVGNIYASEILFLAGVRPTRPGSKVTKAEAKKIVQYTKEVLKRAIKAKGSTFRDYRMADGESGGFQNQFNVYARAGEACKVCSSSLRLIVLGQRSTYWCPQCQK